MSLYILKFLFCPFAFGNLLFDNKLFKQGMMIEFAKNLADFAVASGKKHIVVLSGLDFGRWQRSDMSR